ncbi:hypothetical protein D3P06_07305, partial [Paracoccus aestuarii]
ALPARSTIAEVQDLLRRALAMGLKTLLISRTDVSTENTGLTWKGSFSFSRIGRLDDKVVTKELERGYDETRLKP